MRVKSARLQCLGLAVKNRAYKYFSPTCESRWRDTASSGCKIRIIRRSVF